MYLLRCRDPRFVPDFLFLECTSGLDLVGCETLAGGSLRFHKTVIGPSDIGIPAGGKRLLAVAASNGWAFIGGDPLHRARLEKVLLQSLELKSHDFLLAGKQEVKEWLLTQNNGIIPPHPRGKPYANIDLLPPGAKTRLSRFQRETSAARIKMLQGEIPKEQQVQAMQIWDISQHTTHHASPCSLMPRPTTGSVMWSEGKCRVCTPLELFHLQGTHATFMI